MENNVVNFPQPAHAVWDTAQARDRLRQRLAQIVGQLIDEPSVDAMDRMLDSLQIIELELRSVQICAMMKR